jgi:hypothetical protein
VIEAVEAMHISVKYAHNGDAGEQRLLAPTIRGRTKA